MRKITYYLLIGVVLFIIVQDPGEAGRTAAAFFAWLGNGFEALFEFLGNAFDPDDPEVIVEPDGTTAARHLLAVVRGG